MRMSHPGSGATFVQQRWGMNQGQAEVPHATAQELGAGASLHDKSACDESLQTPCGTMTLPNTVFVKFFFYILSTHKFNSTQGVP